MQGKLKWEKDFGEMDIKLGFGEGISPTLHGDKIVINWDHEGESFIVALNKKTGEEIWKVERDENTSWSTPFILEHGGKTQVIVNATNRIRSYDLANGEVIWACGGMTGNVIPMPVEANGIVYAMSGFRGNALRAIRLAEARGDITDSEAVVWQLDRDTPYTPSPLLYENKLYFLKTNDAIFFLLQCRNRRGVLQPSTPRQTCASFMRLRLLPKIVFILSTEAATALVIKHGSTFEVSGAKYSR